MRHIVTVANASAEWEGQRRVPSESYSGAIKRHPPSTLQLVTTRRLRTAPSRRATAAKSAAVRSLGLVLVDDFAPHRHDPLVRPANLEHSGVVVVEILRRRAEALEAGLLRPAEETAQGGERRPG